ncbi:unnamed protein product [Dovyalis caffra]|uniref:Uncharacterized protein n=1 Tax=Dovyalis caffra TaxID=77055 RepID=A0AAV1QRA2_9ROSI|nr:unnamed protein product [Dovyalis caffra]
MSVALNIQGPPCSPSRSPSRSRSCSTGDQWLDFLTESREPDEVSKRMGPMIPRVPSEFREVEENKDCYEPRVVSIGPYHHGKKELEKMERLKSKLAGQFVQKERSIAEEMYRKVEELVGYARGCYAEELKHQFNDEKFTQMMFLDGNFLLEFLDGKLEKQKLRNEEVALVRRDLFLLENQLPFGVLLSLMRLRFRIEDQHLMAMFEHVFEHIHAIPLQRQSCGEIISKCLSKMPIALIVRSKSPSSEDIPYDIVDHLIELFYIKFIMIEPQTRSDLGTRWHWGTSWNRYHSVNELKKVGIHFKPSNTKVFPDVKFKPTLVLGALHIPPLSIDDSTKPLLLNLAAYEECSGEYSGLLTSYVCFMRSLIDQGEDVKELRSRGILRTTLGSDDEIAQLFKEMTTNLVPNPSAFMEVKNGVESHYRSTWKRWILDHWAPISTAVVKYSFIYGFVVSAIQAYLAETRKKPGFGNCSCPNATQIHP